MTQISRFKLKPETLNKLFFLFFEIVGKKKDQDTFLEIISDLLSPTEKIMVAKRIAVIYLLMKNVKQKTISHTIKVSLSTISRYSLLIQKSNVIPKALDRLVKVENMRLFIDEIFVTLLPPGTPYTNWQSTWNLKKDISKRKNQGF